MHLKNVVIVVKNIEKSKKFYQELFGLQVIRDFESNVILSEGLVLQEKESWENGLGEESTCGCDHELFFKDANFDAFMDKLDDYNGILYKNFGINSWEKRIVRIKDSDGHIIGVAEAWCG
jgi:catechol 2,3-dioxygenase-like lactoylglutathione lyase family enzyme